MAIAQISEMEFKVLLTINRLQAMLFSDIVEAFLNRILSMVIKSLKT